MNIQEEVVKVNVQEEVINVIGNTLKISREEVLLEEKLQDMGISSIDFFTMVLDLSKQIGIEITDLDPTLVSITMTANELISFLNTKTV